MQKQTPYILSIVKNTSLMYLRQRHSENCYLVDDERILDCAATSQDDLDAALISEAESQVIRQALKRLKPRDRDLLEMKYFSQLDDKKNQPAAENLQKQRPILPDACAQSIEG